ncbi:MAG: TolC family protein, partial [Thermodesulfobacteriota bacterium]
FFLVLLLLLFVPISSADQKGDEEPISCPGPLSAIEDQWTDKNREAFEIHLFSIERDLAPPDTPLPLSLEDAFRLALRQNLDLRSERYTTDIARMEIKKAKGAFDAFAFSNFSYDFLSEPLSSQLQGSDTFYFKRESTLFDIGLGKPVKTGGMMELKLEMSRFESNSTFLIINPYYSTRLNLTFSQPLLKNAGTAFQTAPIRIAENLHLISEDRWQEYVTDILVTVSQAYWDLAFAFENLQVRKQSLALAKELLRDNETQVRLGTLAPIDLLQSRTGVALREEEVIGAEAMLESAQDVLKELLQIDQAPTYASTLLLPTDMPSTPPPREDSLLEDAIALAFRNRPEYRAALKELENKNLQIKVAENQLLPVLDFMGNVGLNGLAGGAVPTTDFAAIEKLSPLEQLLVLVGAIPTPTFTSPLDGKWRESYDELFNTDSHQWSLGLRFEYPLENNVGKADYRQAKMDGHRALWALRSLEQKVVLEVKEAWRALEVNRKKIRTSETSVRLARQQLEAEHKRLSLGLSTNYQVLQMEEDLRNVQINSLRAKVDYWKARAKMLKATGTFLQEEEISNDQISRIGRG